MPLVQHQAPPQFNRIRVRVVLTASLCQRHFSRGPPGTLSLGRAVCRSAAGSPRQHLWSPWSSVLLGPPSPGPHVLLFLGFFLIMAEHIFPPFICKGVCWGLFETLNVWKCIYFILMLNWWFGWVWDSRLEIIFFSGLWWPSAMVCELPVLLGQPLCEIFLLSPSLHRSFSLPLFWNFIMQFLVWYISMHCAGI